MALGTPSPALTTSKAASSVSGAVGGWGGGGGEESSTSGFQFPRLPGSPTPQQTQAQQPVVMGSPTQQTRVQSDTFAPGTWDPIQSLISNQSRTGTGLDPSTTNALNMLLNVNPANMATQGGHMYTNYNNQIAGNNLALQGVGLSRETLGNQGARYDLDSQGNQVDRDYIGTMRGIAEKSLANQIGGIKENEATDRRNIGSGYTSRGAWFTPFHSADLNDASQRAQRSRDDAQYGYDRGEAGYNRDLAKLGLSDQNIDLSRRDLSTAYKRLDLEAARLNLTAKEYYDALQQGLQNLGISGGFDIIDTMSTLDAQGLEQFLTLLVGASGNQQLLGNSIASATGNPGYGG
jgi:hypothetical protein